MPVTLVATAGGATSNSYCTIAEATVYHGKRFLNTAWTDADKKDCEKVLMWSTRLMDQLNWRGQKTDQNQALRWPRVGCADREGFPTSYTDIPTVIKDACAEWAFYLLTEDRTLDEGGLVEIKGGVGPIKNPDMYIRKSMPDGVREMLAPFINGAGVGYGRVSRV